MHHNIQAIFTGALLTLFLLSIQHFGLWEVKMPLVARYTLGTAAIGAGLTLTGYIAGDWFAVVGFWSIAICGGALIAPLHLWRHHRNERPADINDAFHAGSIVRRAQEGNHAVSGKRNDRSN